MVILRGGREEIVRSIVNIIFYVRYYSPGTLGSFKVNQIAAPSSSYSKRKEQSLPALTVSKPLDELEIPGVRAFVTFYEWK